MLYRGAFILAVGFELLTDVWKAVSVKTLLLQLQTVVVFVLVQQLVLAADCRARIVSVEILDVRFVDTTMSKASLIGRLIDDHGVFHIVSSVRDDSHNCISPTWAYVKIIFKVLASAHQWPLRKQKSIDFVIHSIRVVMVRCSHSLLGHLTLVHITWTLVVVAEGNC